MEVDRLSNEYIEVMSNLYHKGTFNCFAEYYQGEMRILTSLIKSKEKCILPSDLVKSLGMTSPRVSNALKTLEKKGYITRDFSTADRRKVYVNITPSGLQYVANKTSKLYGIFDCMFQALGEQDTKELIRILKCLSETSMTK